MEAYKAKRIIGKIIFYIAIVAICLIIIFPLYFVFISSFKNMADVYVMPPKLLGFKPVFSHYEYIFTTQNYGFYILNSAIVGIFSTLFALMLGLPAAYAINRNRMKNSLLGILVARLLPPMSFLLPFYFIFSELGMVDTYGALILSHMVLSVPLIVWLMEGFIAGIPRELDEVDRLSFRCANQEWRQAQFFLSLAHGTISSLRLFSAVQGQEHCLLRCSTLFPVLISGGVVCLQLLS